MSDPYLDITGDNDKSDIQVNVFRVRGPLRNMSVQEKHKALHKEVIIFNPGKSPPEIDNIKLPERHKIIKEKI